MFVALMNNLLDLIPIPGVLYVDSGYKLLEYPQVMLIRPLGGGNGRQLSVQTIQNRLHAANLCSNTGLLEGCHDYPSP